MDGNTVTHEHDKSFIHPRTGKYICWCRYPFCTEISRLKKRERNLVLTSIYELIQRDKRNGNIGLRLDRFFKK